MDQEERNTQQQLEASANDSEGAIGSTMQDEMPEPGEPPLEPEPEEEGDTLECKVELESEPEWEVLSDVELNEVIESICNSKAEEFRMIGYEHVTGMEIWECVSDKYKKTGTPPLHKVVNDILSLKVTQFMNWMTMSIYKTNPFK
ncbi:post-transcriptional regulator [Paenibacillus sp. RC67]|uniref:post-transcriptional regulator n=1 Tax=Paenibacillus sp. RC67 TaxID=3039392 RepID=UPI0032C227E6